MTSAVTVQISDASAGHRMRTTMGWLIGVVVLLAACTAHRATTTEQAILPEAGKEKFWLFHTVGKTLDSVIHHYALLLTQRPTASGKATSFFVAHWDDGNKAFEYGCINAPNAAWSKAARWPMNALLRADSTEADWQFYFNRHALQLKGLFQAPASRAFSLRGQFARTDSLQVLAADTFPQIEVLQHGHGTLVAGHAHMDGDLMGAVFVDAGALLSDPMIKAVYWLQIMGLDATWNRSLLFFMDADGHLRWVKAAAQQGTGALRSQLPWQDNGQFFPQMPWRSSHSGKTYALALAYRAPYEAFLIRPRAEDQEIRAGKKSFWMGAVEMVDDARSQTPLALGNMYIFQK